MLKIIEETDPKNGNLTLVYYTDMTRRVDHPSGQYYNIVQLTDGFLNCTCKESCFEGIACCHELCVAIKVFNKIDHIFVKERWRKEYFNLIDIPQANESDSENEDESQRSEGNDQVRREQIEDDVAIEVKIEAQHNTPSRNHLSRSTTDMVSLGDARYQPFCYWLFNFARTSPNFETKDDRERSQEGQDDSSYYSPQNSRSARKRDVSHSSQDDEDDLSYDSARYHQRNERKNLGDSPQGEENISRAKRISDYTTTSGRKEIQAKEKLSTTSVMPKTAKVAASKERKTHGSNQGSPTSAPPKKTVVTRSQNRNAQPNKKIVSQSETKQKPRSKSKQSQSGKAHQQSKGKNTGRATYGNRSKSQKNSTQDLGFCDIKVKNLLAFVLELN